NPADFGVPPVYASSITLGNPGGILGYPLSTRPTQNYDASVHFTWIHGAHSFKFGGNFDYASTFSLRNRARSALDSFQGDFSIGTAGTGFETLIDQLLLGRIDEAARSFGDTSRHLYQPSLGIFFQDEWKIRPRVTVSYGLRWEVNGALGDADKIASNFYPCAGQELTNCPPGGAPAGLVRVGIGNPRLYNLDLHDFGPRAGVAWDVFGNGKTSLRVGYSMVYDVANFAAISAPYVYQGARAGSFTNSNLGVFSVTAVGNVCTGVVDANGCEPSAANGGVGTGLQNLFQAFGSNTCYNPATNTNAVNPATGTSGPDWVCIGPQPGTGAVPFQTYGSNPTGTPPFNIFGVTPDLKTPRIQYYSLTLQHELFRNNVISVGYFGSHGSDMYLNRSLNQLPIGCFTAAGQQTGPPNSANNSTNLNCVRPFDSVFLLNGVPNFNYVVQLTNDGFQRYNALQVTYRQRDWHGFNSIINFTWSNCIDSNSVNRGGGSTLPIAENPYNPSSNQGPCDTDVRRNFNTGIAYDFPKWTAAGRFGSGWQVGSLVTALSGRPYTILVSSTADN